MAFKSRISGLDFKPKQKKRRAARPLRLHWIVLGISTLIALSLLLMAKDKAGAMPEQSTANRTPAKASDSHTVELPIPRLTDPTNEEKDQAPAAVAPTPPSQGHSQRQASATPSLAKPNQPTGRQGSSPVNPSASIDDTDDSRWNTITVKAGDSLTSIFRHLALSPKDVFAVVHADDESSKGLTQLYPGEKIGLRLNNMGNLLAVRRRLNQTETLTVSRATAGADFHVTLAKHPLERRIAHTSATIHESLYQAALSAGLDENLIMEFSRIFGWDIDFVHDIRDGDSFSLIYTQYYKDGELVRNGNILAAEFTNQGKRYRAVRYTDPSDRTGYFTPDGKNMRKAFLRMPVDFRRISSHFSKMRCHPILHVCRPHEGTDFAAATGTPIEAAGDGIVAFAGRKGGYGNAVILHHSHNYSTLYGHMQRIRKGIHAGVRVKQGQIIGYVGHTGLATGPHLHYEFRVNGVPKDVLKVRLPDAKPIDPRYFADFKAKALPRLAQLTVITRTQLARNEQGN